MVKNLFKQVLLVLFLMAFSGNTLVLAADNKEVKKTEIKKEEQATTGNNNPLNDEKIKKFECVFERNNIPPKSEEGDKLYEEVQELYGITFIPKEDFTDEEKLNIFNLTKKAAGLGSWRAKNALGHYYVTGFGVETDLEKAKEIFGEMIKENIPIGFYGKFLIDFFLQDSDFTKHLAVLSLKKAADLGAPYAQVYLWNYYYAPVPEEHAEGLRYLICAARQGDSAALYSIAEYLQQIDGNYSMAMEYFWRAAAAGSPAANLIIYNSLTDGVSEDEYNIIRSFVKYNTGYDENQEMAKYFYENYKNLLENRNLTFADLFEKYQIPENSFFTKEEGYNTNSLLKEAFAGKWPHEMFSELAPGYIASKY